VSQLMSQSKTILGTLAQGIDSNSAKVVTTVLNRMLAHLEQLLGAEPLARPVQQTLQACKVGPQRILESHADFLSYAHADEPSAKDLAREALQEIDRVLALGGAQPSMQEIVWKKMEGLDSKPTRHTALSAPVRPASSLPVQGARNTSTAMQRRRADAVGEKPSLPSPSKAVLRGGPRSTDECPQVARYRRDIIEYTFRSVAQWTIDRGYTQRSPDSARQIVARVFGAWFYHDNAKPTRMDPEWSLSPGSKDPVVGLLREKTCAMVLMRKTGRHLWIATQTSEEVLTRWARDVAKFWIKKLQGWILQMYEHMEHAFPSTQLLPETGWDDALAGVTVEKDLFEKTKHLSDKNVVGLMLDGVVLQRLSKDVYQRLAKRYDKFGAIREHMHTRMLNMALRYQQVMGEPHWNKQIPIRLYRELKSEMGVNLECFASPLNARLDHYCSVFSDCDKCFCSEGSFFDFYPTSGSFQVHPPMPMRSFLVEDHLLDIFSKSNGPLSFVVIIPASHFRTVKKHRVIEKYMKQEFYLDSSCHSFVDGVGQEASENRRYGAIGDGTSIVILQNPEGGDMWPWDPEAGPTIVAEAFI